MISGIISSGSRYVNISNGSNKPYISKSYSLAATGKQGDMMYDLDGQNIKVFDGSIWQTLAGNLATIDLTSEATILLDWAKKKRDEELELEKMANENPAIKDLVEQIKQKQDQLKMVQTLIKKETTV
jgi:hypothetical protein